MKKIGLIFILSLFVFYSCTNRQFYETYVAKTDSLTNSLEAAASSYETLDTLLIQTHYQFINLSLDSLVNFPDVLLDTNLVQFRILQKKYKTFLREHPLTVKELNFCRNQLLDLKHDFENRNPEIEKAEKYYMSEEEAVIYIKKRMDAYQLLIVNSMAKFDSIQPNIVTLIDSISNSEKN